MGLRCLFPVRLFYLMPEAGFISYNDCYYDTSNLLRSWLVSLGLREGLLRPKERGGLKSITIAAGCSSLI